MHRLREGNTKLPLQRSSLKRASRSHAKTGSFLMFFPCFFGLVPDGVFLCFFLVCMKVWGPRWVQFSAFCKKRYSFVRKGGTLVFAHHYSVLARFLWFEASWEAQKIRKNSFWKIMFFWLQEKGPKMCFFMILGLCLNPFWSSGAIQNHRIRVCFWICCLGGSPGSFWDPFWLDFGGILDRFWEQF